MTYEQEYTALRSAILRHIGISKDNPSIDPLLNDLLDLLYDTWEEGHETALDNRGQPPHLRKENPFEPKENS